MKSFRCEHAGLPCGAQITGDTDEEVLQKAAEHAKKAHGVDITVSQTLVGYAGSLIREEGEPAAVAASEAADTPSSESSESSQP